MSKSKKYVPSNGSMHSPKFVKKLREEAKLSSREESGIQVPPVVKPIGESESEKPGRRKRKQERSIRAFPPCLKKAS